MIPLASNKSFAANKSFMRSKFKSIPSSYEIFVKDYPPHSIFEENADWFSQKVTYSQKMFETSWDFHKSALIFFYFEPSPP
jgi:hypothetical protein